MNRKMIAQLDASSLMKTYEEDSVSLTGLSLFNVDFKLTDSNISILEFSAGIGGLYNIESSMTKDTVADFWHFVDAKLDIPVYFLASPNYYTSLGEEQQQAYRMVYGLDILEDEGLGEVVSFERCHELLDFIVPASDFDPFDFSTYSALVVNYQRYATNIELLQQAYPHILFLNGNCNANEIMKNKLLTHTFFDTNIVKYAPKYLLGNKTENMDKLLMRVDEKLPGDRYIIKPLGACCSMGVIATDRDHLKENLSIVMNPPLSYKQDISNTLLKRDPVKYWSFEKERSNFFLIEEFILGKRYQLDGSDYLGTLRGVFSIMSHPSKLELNLHNLFWQLAPEPFGDNNFSRSAVISNYYDSTFLLEQERYQTVSDLDKDIFVHDLPEIMKVIYPKMYLTPPEDIVYNLLFKSADKQHTNYGMFLRFNQ